MGSVASSRSLFKAVFFPFIKLVHTNRPEIYNFWATVPVLFLLNAFSTVVGIGDSWSIANEAAVVICAVIAFIANTNENSGSNVRVTDNALPFAFLAEATDGNPPLFPAHDKIRMMFGHSLITIYYLEIRYKSNIEVI